MHIFMDNGRLLEEPFKECAIDNFEKHNYDAKYFFLSHCHTDHMKGMYGGFGNHLIENDVAVYCSDLSKKFLKSKFRDFPEDKLVVLDRGPNVFEGPAGPFTVTPLRAGHCPGSIMFLFSNGNINVLYTGDFRLSPKDLENVQELYDMAGELIQIDTLYLDTTFANCTYESFPSRKESLEHIVKHVEWWFQRHPKNMVILSPPGNIGIEYLLLELSKEFKTRVHIIRKLFWDYHCHISALEDHVTVDPVDMKIHLCKGWGDGNCCDCKDLDKKRVLTIRPSAQHFSEEILRSDGPFSLKNNFLRVAYSSHCSYEELCQFIIFLKPRKIEAMIYDSYKDAEIVKRLEALTKLPSPPKAPEPSSPLKNIQLSPSKEVALRLRESKKRDYREFGLESPPLQKEYKLLKL